MIGGNATDKRGVRAVIRTTLCVLAFALASLSTLAHVLPPAIALPAVLLAMIAWGLCAWAFFPAQQAALRAAAWSTRYSPRARSRCGWPVATPPVVHAIVHGLPARANGLDEEQVNAPGFAGFGMNSRGARNYRGPRPILGHGAHRYVFQLFALAQPLQLAGPLTKKALRAALSGGGVLARGELVGTYERR